MTTKIDMRRHIPALIATAGARISLHAQREAARPLGLDVREWRIMQIVGEADDRTVNEIADRIGMDRGGTSRSVAQLEKQGLVSRHDDLADRRRVLLRLTEKGGKLQEQIAAFAAAREERLLSALTTGQVEALRDALLIVADEAERMLAEGWRPERA